MPRRVPSFKDHKPASEASSKAKKANKRRDTAHEVMLRRELWKMGLRYRKNVATLPGKPDIVFLRYRLVIFCDGDFWHGRNWPELREKLSQGSNPSYWIPKIQSNIERDQRVTQALREAGWHVLRLWETDIRADPAAMAQKVKEVIDNTASASQRGGDHDSNIL